MFIVCSGSNINAFYLHRATNAGLGYTPSNDACVVMISGAELNIFRTLHFNICKNGDTKILNNICLFFKASYCKHFIKGKDSQKRSFNTQNSIKTRPWGKTFSCDIFSISEYQANVWILWHKVMDSMIFISFSIIQSYIFVELDRNIPQNSSFRKNLHLTKLKIFCQIR